MNICTPICAYIHTKREAKKVTMQFIKEKHVKCVMFDS